MRREYRRKPQDNPVDYALSLNRAECLLIEAKSLEKELNDRKWISQNLSYATVLGIPWCVLTNGDEYRIYNSHAAVDVDQKLFRSVRLSDAASSTYAAETLQLLSKEQMRGRLLDDLWKLHFIDRGVRSAMELFFKNQDASLVKLICKRAKGLAAVDVRAALKRARLSVDFPASALSCTSTDPSLKGSRTSNGRKSTNGGSRAARVAPGPTIDDLISAGLLNPPVQLERNYKGVHLKAVLGEDGKVECNGHLYDSLSTAAGAARKSVLGGSPTEPHPQTNGWTFWMCANESGGELHEIDQLRKNCAATGGNAVRQS